MTMHGPMNAKQYKISSSHDVAPKEEILLLKVGKKTSRNSDSLVRILVFCQNTPFCHF